jgi:hypothetical protein
MAAIRSAYLAPYHQSLGVHDEAGPSSRDFTQVGAHQSRLCSLPILARPEEDDDADPASWSTRRPFSRYLLDPDLLNGPSVFVF